LRFALNAKERRHEDTTGTLGGNFLALATYDDDTHADSLARCWRSASSPGVFDASNFAPSSLRAARSDKFWS
jgi:hypothetical protein